MTTNRPITRPLQPMELMVLTVLFDESQHGYGLVNAIQERTGDSFRVRPGNLYRVLDRLVNADLIAESSAAGAASGGAERTRSFSITATGRNRVLSETEILGRAIGGSATLKRAIERGLASTP